MSPQLPDSVQNEPQLLLEWAWTQVEAMADGSLNSAQRRRMQQAMNLDPALLRAVQQARSLLRQLWGEPRASASVRLRWRLWWLPRTHPQMRSTRSGSAPRAWRGWGLATACGLLALTVALPLFRTSAPQTPVANTQQQAAVRDFDIAMAYVRKSALISQRATSRSLGGSLQHAFSVSWQTWINDDFQLKNGD